MRGEENRKEKQEGVKKKLKNVRGRIELGCLKSLTEKKEEKKTKMTSLSKILATETDVMVTALNIFLVWL